MLFDWRAVTRFVSAYEAARDLGVTITAPHGLLHVEAGGVSFTLVQDRTTGYVHMFPAMKGRRVFHTSITSHRGDWKSTKAWRFGWEHRSRFNPLIAVTPQRLYELMPESGRLVEIDGDNLVLTAMKKSNQGGDLIARVYDAAGNGELLGLRLTAPYLGHRPFEINQYRFGATKSLSDRPLQALAVLKANSCNLLEDLGREIKLDELRAGSVGLRGHEIATIRLAYEQPTRDWIATYEVRTADAQDDGERPH